MKLAVKTKQRSARVKQLEPFLHPHIQKVTLPHLLVVCCTLESWLFVSIVLRVFAKEKVADAKIQKTTTTTKKQTKHTEI